MSKKHALKKKEESLALTTVEDFFVTGDLSKVGPVQRFNMYVDLCRSLKLNPLTQPFGYISIDGRMCLYSKKDCAEQLRKIHGVSITSLEREWDKENNLLMVNVTGKDKYGKVDAATGALDMTNKDGKPFKGKDLANAIMKCETKAKRRLTLSICGLSMPDQTEVETIHGAEVDETVEKETLSQIKKTKGEKPMKDANPKPTETKVEEKAKRVPQKEATIEDIIKALPDDVKGLLKANGHDSVVKAARVYRAVEGDVDAMRQLLEAETKANLKK